MSRAAEDEARARAKAHKQEQQRAEAATVWKEVRAKERSVLERTRKLREERLAQEAEPPAKRAQRG